MPELKLIRYSNTSNCEKEIIIPPHLQSQVLGAKPDLASVSVKAARHHLIHGPGLRITGLESLPYCNAEVAEVYVTPRMS
ncbi:hypothetical protein TNCV_1085181 [Trichonephila clavipes]|nr:hypothetical protein TNCV_1085181 [Trichonephila clavipes]